MLFGFLLPILEAGLQAGHQALIQAAVAILVRAVLAPGVGSLVGLVTSTVAARCVPNSTASRQGRGKGRRPNGRGCRERRAPTAGVRSRAVRLGFRSATARSAGRGCPPSLGHTLSSSIPAPFSVRLLLLIVIVVKAHAIAVHWGAQAMRGALS